MFSVDICVRTVGAFNRDFVGFFACLFVGVGYRLVIGQTENFEDRPARQPKRHHRDQTGDYPAILVSLSLCQFKYVFRAVPNTISNACSHTLA